jgi:hypothetical protein
LPQRPKPFKQKEKEGRRGNTRDDSIDIYERENRLYFMNYLLGGNTGQQKKSAKN